MQKQQTLSDLEYSSRKKKTKREEFLEIMDEIIPWDEWVGIIAPHYPSSKRGRPPIGIERILRMYLLQIWFNLSDPATEDAIYDSYAMRKFTGINFMTERVPDETTLCRFRHMLEEQGLNKLFFEAINRVMVSSGHMMKGGTIVDATIINAPSSAKNAEKARDPEMHQTKKGNEWRFGMKCHIGADAGSGLVHTIEVTAANEHGITVACKLIRKDDTVVYGDSGYRLRRFRLSWYSKAFRGSVRHALGRNRLPHQPPAAQFARCFRQHHRLGAHDRAPQILCPLQGRARLPHHQVPVWLHKNQVPGLKEKRQSAVRYVCVRESLCAGDGRAKSQRGMTRDHCAQFRETGGNTDA